MARWLRICLGEKKYDLCLIDIGLPVMTGEELYQWLKEKHPKLASRVIFTTGSVVGEETMPLIKQSGRPLLPKPFTLAQLKAIVRETLRQIEK